MALWRCGRTWLGLAVALAGLVPGGASAAEGGYIGRYISPDFCAALVIHPERIGQSTLAEAVKSALPKELATVGTAQAVAALSNQKNLPPGVDVAKLTKLLEGKPVRRIVILVDPFPLKNVPSAPGVIVQFGADIDADGILSAIG
jgi:hypothetical protein